MSKITPKNTDLSNDNDNNSKEAQANRYNTTDGIKVKMKKKTKKKNIEQKIVDNGEVVKDFIENARSWLENHSSQFGTKIIENTMELDSYEIIENEKNEKNYEVTLSYYTKNRSFDSDNTNGFQIPNVKNYRKIVLNEKGQVFKITSKID